MNLLTRRFTFGMMGCWRAEGLINPLRQTRLNLATLSA